MYVYIDESGILTPGQGDYFLVAAYAVSDREVASRCLKKIRQQNMKKQYKKLGELKFNNSPPEMRRRILSCLVTEDFQVYYIAFEKTSGERNQFALKGFLFATLLERIYQDYGFISEVYIDKFLKKSQEVVFSEYLSAVPVDGSIHYLDSQRCPGIQVADFLSGALNQHYNAEKADDDVCYEIIEEKLVKIR